MASMASPLLRAVRNASLTSRATAAASRSRSARAAGAVAATARRLGSHANPPSRFALAADYAHLPDDAKTPTDADMESDEAVWALYERWRRAFNRERDLSDHAEMARRFKLFRDAAEHVHSSNTSVPADPWEADVYLGKRREAELLLARDEDVSHLDECHMPRELGPFADGGDPYLDERDMSRLKGIEEDEERMRLKEIEDEERDADSAV